MSQSGLSAALFRLAELPDERKRATVFKLVAGGREDRAAEPASAISGAPK
jgi:hypothetical protein